MNYSKIGEALLLLGVSIACFAIFYWRWKSKEKDMIDKSRMFSSLVFGIISFVGFIYVLFS